MKYIEVKISVNNEGREREQVIKIPHTLLGEGKEDCLNRAMNELSKTTAWLLKGSMKD